MSNFQVANTLHERYWQLIQKDAAYWGEIENKIASGKYVLEDPIDYMNLNIGMKNKPLKESEILFVNAYHQWSEAVERAKQNQEIPEEKIALISKIPESVKALAFKI